MARQQLEEWTPPSRPPRTNLMAFLQFVVGVIMLGLSVGLGYVWWYEVERLFAQILFLVGIGTTFGIASEAFYNSGTP